MSLWNTWKKVLSITVIVACFAFVFLGNTCLAFASSEGLDGKWETK